MWRCINDYFGYCKGVPRWSKRPESLGAGEFPGRGLCKLDPKTCGQYQTLEEQLRGKSLPKPQYKVIKGGRLVKVKDD